MKTLSMRTQRRIVGICKSEASSYKHVSNAWQCQEIGVIYLECMPASREGSRNDVEDVHTLAEERDMVVSNTAEVVLITCPSQEETVIIIFRRGLVSLVRERTRFDEATFSGNHSIEQPRCVDERRANQRILST